MDKSDLTKLREPFPAKDLEWRIQTAGKTKQGKLYAILIPYIDNRAVQNRLDEVCGVENWTNEFEYNDSGKGVVCGISIYLGEPDGVSKRMTNTRWATKYDGAEDTQVEAVKGGLSSAMKRAAVQWGIGRYLYNLDSAIVTPQTDAPQDMSDWIVTKAKIEGRYERIYFKRPKLPEWALPATSTEAV